MGQNFIFAYGQGRGAAPLPPYGRPDHKISVSFWRLLIKRQDIWSMLFCVMHATFMSNNINFSNVFCIHKMKCNVDLNIRLLSNVNFSLLFFPLHCLTFSRHLYLLSHLLLTHIKVFKNALFTLPTWSSKHLHRALLLTVPPHKWLSPEKFI